MLRLAPLAVLALSSTAAAEAPPAPRPLADCPGVTSLALGTRVAATRKTTYRLDGTDVRVCVERASYPYRAGRGHQLLACLVVAEGKREERACGTANTIFHDVGAHRITVSLRTPRFTESSEVWLQIDARP